MIFTSEYESVEVGGATLPDLVLEAAAAAGERPALIDGVSGEVIGYSQLAREIDEVATGLLARGFGEGGVLALQAPNVPRWASVALGAMAVGGCVTGVHPAATDGELARQLQDAGATMLVTAHSLDELITGEAPRSGRTRASDDTLPALLPYSSGTTGLPKGVVLTHRNLVASVRQMDRGLRLSERDVLPAVAPFCHVMGFVLGLAAGLSAGATVVTVPRFDFQEFLGILERHRATFVAVPPPIAKALATHPLVERHDLSSLELIA